MDASRKFTFTSNGTRFRIHEKYLKDLGIFERKPQLLKKGRYELHSQVPDGVIDLFIDALEGYSITIPEGAVSGLKELCYELGFTGLDEQIKFVEHFGVTDTLAIKREILLLREMLEERDETIQQLTSVLEELRTDFYTEQVRYESLEKKVTGVEERCDKIEKEIGSHASSTEVTLEALKNELSLYKSAELQFQNELKELKEREASLAQTQVSRRRITRAATADRIPKRDVSEAQKAPKGIIGNLRDKFGGNIAESGVIEITPSSVFRQQCNRCTQVIDYGWKSYWMTDNQENSWLQFDFKKNQVNITSYTITSGGAFGYDLLHWVLEVSDDPLTDSWERIDERDTEELKGCFVKRTFTCNLAQQGKFTRYVRLRQTKENSSGKFHLVLSEIEFFGQLVPLPGATPAQ